MFVDSWDWDRGLSGIACVWKIREGSCVFVGLRSWVLNNFHAVLGSVSVCMFDDLYVRSLACLLAFPFVSMCASVYLSVWMPACWCVCLCVQFLSVYAGFFFMCIFKHLRICA